MKTTIELTERVEWRVVEHAGHAWVEPAYDPNTPQQLTVLK